MSSSSASSPYASKGGNKSLSNDDNNADDDLSSLTRKVEHNLRKNIRLFATYPFASQQWVETANRIADVASIVEAERNIAEASEESNSGSNNLSSIGRGNKHGSSTLWETEEHALRFLLEENKFSVLLRIGEEHVRNRKLLTSLSVSQSILTTPSNTASSSSSTVVSLQAFVDGGSTVSASAENSSNSNSSESVSSFKLSELLKIFNQLEHGLTVLYTIAWLHPEITQLMDVPLVITLLSETMGTAVATYHGDIGGSKQYTSSLTLFSLGLHMWYSLGTSIVQGRPKAIETIITELIRQNSFGNFLLFSLYSIELYSHHYNTTTHKLKDNNNKTSTNNSLLPYQKPFTFTVLLNTFIGISNLLNGEEYLVHKNKIFQQILSLEDPVKKQNNYGIVICTKLRDYINNLILQSPSPSTGASTLGQSLSPNRIYSSGGGNSNNIGLSPSSSMMVPSSPPSQFLNTNSTNTVVRKQIRPFIDLLDAVIRKK